MHRTWLGHDTKRQGTSCCEVRADSVHLRWSLDLTSASQPLGFGISNGVPLTPAKRQRTRLEETALKAQVSWLRVLKRDATRGVSAAGVAVGRSQQLCAFSRSILNTPVVIPAFLYCQY